MADKNSLLEDDETPVTPADPAAGLAALALAQALGRGRAKAGKTAPDLMAFLKQQSGLAARQSELAGRQRALVDLQIERLEIEGAIHHKAMSLHYLGERLRIGLQILAILAGTIVLVGLGAMVWQAHEERGLVIDAFSVPPDLARDGLTGEVVAARFLDQLQAMQAAVVSERPADTYLSNWGADIKVEIPTTGLTLSEFERLLREKLGHTSHVSGEVIRTADGITLTARLAREPPQTFSGTVKDLDALARKSAEAVYRANQPYRYAQYLNQHGRLDEAIGVASDLAQNGPPGERAWAYAILANIGIQRGDLAAARSAIAAGLQSGGSGVLQVKINEVTVQEWSGHSEAVLDLSIELDRNEVRKRSEEISEAAFQETNLVNTAYMAGFTGDYGLSVTDYRELARIGGVVLPRPFSAVQAADAMAMNHDPDGAAAALIAAGYSDATDLFATEAANGFYALPDYEIAAARGDWRTALAAVLQVEALIVAQQATHPMLRLMDPVLVRPLWARALAETGDFAGAEAAIASTPLDCDLCLRVRGRIATLGGDVRGADRWYGEAVRLGPKVPLAYAEWGEAKLARGDVTGAVTLLEMAHAKGPRFPDPLKVLGDAYVRAGDVREALEQYDAALKLAPAWTALRRARAAAAAQVR
jgi:tetratricopeptide (TPR) repeat protein